MFKRKAYDELKNGKKKAMAALQYYLRAPDVLGNQQSLRNLLKTNIKALFSSILLKPIKVFFHSLMTLTNWIFSF